MILPALPVGVIPGDVEDGALHSDPNGLFRIGPCARAVVSPTACACGFRIDGSFVIPSASFNCSYVITSSFGGASSTGCLGMKLLRDSRCGRGEVRGSAMLTVV